jgi:hypothetical protein
LRVVATHAWQETRKGWYDWYCNATLVPVSPRSILTKLLDPFWAARRIELVPSGPAQIARHGVAAIVFEKTGVTSP